MRPKLSELEKTAIELRRAIIRLQNMAEINPKGFAESHGMTVLELLTQARNAIPERYKDVDLEV